jgi:hypothetical protein
MNQEEEVPLVYYAFNPKGNKIIAGPFKSRIEAKSYSKKVGMACRLCCSYSGGNTICYGCIVICFENQRKEERETGSKRKKAKKRN